MRLEPEEGGLQRCSGKGFAFLRLFVNILLTSHERYPLQYGMGEEAAELRLDLGLLGRVMSCVAGQEVVVVHSQDDERDEVAVVFDVNTGRLLGTFEGARESLLGGGTIWLSGLFSDILCLGGVVSQTQSGIMEVRKVVDGGLLLLGAIEDLRRRSSHLNAIFININY